AISYARPEFPEGSNPVLRGDAHGTRACAEKLRKTPAQRLKSSQVWPRMIAVEVRRLVARNPSTVPDTLSLSRRSRVHGRSTVFCESVRMNDEYPYHCAKQMQPESTSPCSNSIWNS